MHRPCFLGLELGVAGGRIFDALLFNGLRHFFLAAAVRANTYNEQSFVFVLFQQLVIVRNGGHTRSAPGGVKIHNDNFAFHFLGFDLAIDPAGEIERRHRFAF